MKYKVGDKVRVKKSLVTGKNYGNGYMFRNDMVRYMGKEVTISRVGDDFYKIKDDVDYWSWTDDMFEDVSETPTEGKVQTVDVGYYLAFCGHRVIKDVYQDGNYNGKPFFTSADGFNQYILPKDAIEWIIPHPQEIYV